MILSIWQLKKLKCYNTTINLEKNVQYKKLKPLHAIAVGGKGEINLARSQGGSSIEIQAEV